MEQITIDNQQTLVEYVGDNILTLKKITISNGNVEFSLTTVPIDVSSKIIAISHRWNENALQYPVKCTVDGSYYWLTNVQNKVWESIAMIWEKFGDDFMIWMDQICIPQMCEAFKQAQITFMGKLYSIAVAVICGRNGMGYDFNWNDYSSRAWTPQEFSFGKVYLHPSLEESLPLHEQSDIYLGTFTKLSGSFALLVDCAKDVLRQTPGVYLSHEAERSRVTKITNSSNNPQLNVQVSNFYDAIWGVPASEQSLVELLRNFRNNSPWDGSSLVDENALVTMCFANSRDSKDQLYGVYGSAYYARTGNLLPYDDPEQAFIFVLLAFGWPLMCLFRCRNHDEDGTGADGYLSPPGWRNVPGERRFRTCRLAYHFPGDFATAFPFRRQDWPIYRLGKSIEIWQFQRDHRTWWAIGFSKDRENRIGRCVLCVEKQSRNVKRNRLIAFMLRYYFQNCVNFFSSGDHVWVFELYFEQLLNEIDRDAAFTRQYKIDEEINWKLY